MSGGRTIRCPICGGLAKYWNTRGFWVCNCAGPLIKVFPWATAGNRFDEELEECRQIMVKRGFGWSWFTPEQPPVFGRGED